MFLDYVNNIGFGVFLCVRDINTEKFYHGYRNEGKQ